jgi:hypothetical protein
MGKSQDYAFVDREPCFGFLNRSALAYSACKIGIFTPVRQETLSRNAEVYQRLTRCSRQSYHKKKKKIQRKFIFLGNRARKFEMAG